MSKPTPPVAPDESRMEDLLARIQPVPSEGFQQRMKQAAWRARQEKQVHLKNLQFKLAFVLLVLAMLATLFITPLGRAWAQEVFQFFGRINALTIEMPESTSKWAQDINSPYDLPLVPVFIPTVSPEMAAIPGCESAQKSQSYFCQVALAESKLGFNLKELPVLPEGWKFDFMQYDTNSKTATLGYMFDFSYNSYATLYLLQGEGNYPEMDQNSPWGLVPADQVEKVKVGHYDGEYVEGSFFGQPKGKDLVWEDTNERKRLAWSDGTRSYLIDIWLNLNLPDRIDREQMIKLAESLGDTSVETTQALDPENLYSVSDAEKLSGLDLKAPTLLPMDISFSHAHYSPDTHVVRLFYGPNEEMIISEWQGKSIDFNTLPKDYDPNSSYEHVRINGKGAFYGFVEGPQPYHLLWWEEDGRSYQMYFYQYFGARMEKEEMIMIAESMQDIDDFRTKQARPYEYISIYGHALGFDPLEFEKTPAGWTYSTVGGVPPGRCVYTFYKSVTEPGYLSLNQCQTDQYFNLSDIPIAQRQPVRIGNQTGIYVEGTLITKDNGKLDWSSDPSFKQLYWQENGLWINMALAGESAALHSKEDLISYAESLR